MVTVASKETEVEGQNQCSRKKTTTARATTQPTKLRCQDDCFHVRHVHWMLCGWATAQERHRGSEPTRPFVGGHRRPSPASV